MTILDEIIQYKYKEVAAREQHKSISDLTKNSLFERETYSFKTSIRDAKTNGIIAEFKRKSPSKGLINGTALVEEVTAAYVQYGAAALSILTDEKYFGGCTADLIAARAVNKIPVLRKDFIVSEYQIFEAKAMGADVILLIAASLTKQEVSSFAKRAKELNLEVLLEVHTLDELNSITENVDVVGVNNRNLKDFTVDIQRSISLSEYIPDEFVKISESGISDVDSIQKLKQFGFEGFLIGENFMKTKNPGAAFAQFAQTLNNIQVTK